MPESETLMRFLENNGKNLKELTLHNISETLKLSMAQFCPNLKKLNMVLGYNELYILKIILNDCQYLESIQVWCSDYSLNEKETLEVVAKYSPKGFYELKIYNDGE